MTQSQKETITNLKETGIQFEFPKEDLVIVRQKEVVYNQLFSNKQLHTLGRELFEAPIIIKPVVYSLDLNTISLEWVISQMELYRINAKDLQRQLGFKKDNITGFLKLGKQLKPEEKSSLYYYFLSFKSNVDYLDYLKSKNNNSIEF
ncbi:hypothetical protein [Flavobacterium sp.]|uniref:hypothetical protein n=1 Tax=Flavobacterium sp. TaxID=239 RepID=UPI001B61EB82|nr:hypothetical protein [Flavobacterium sp.]MBP6127993.1 hypothetical protein [Flavobacterium sp.]MBP6387244.1 hypothetical protein [Pseudarcicella sp.]